MKFTVNLASESRHVCQSNDVVHSGNLDLVTQLNETKSWPIDLRLQK